MKKLMIGLALAALATPALANSAMIDNTQARTAGVPGDGQHYILPERTTTSPAYGAYAYAPEPNYGAYAAANSGLTVSYPTAVYENGEYQGADPDPSIRLQLRRGADEEMY